MYGHCLTHFCDIFFPEFQVFSTSIESTVDFNPLNIGWNKPLWYDSHIYLATLWDFHMKNLEKWKEAMCQIWHVWTQRVKMVDFFRFLLYREVLKFWSYQTIGWECIRKASLMRLEIMLKKLCECQMHLISSRYLINASDWISPNFQFVL